MNGDGDQMIGMEMGMEMGMGMGMGMGMEVWGWRYGDENGWG